MDEHSDKDSTSTKIYWPKNGEIAYCFHQRWGILPVINMFGDVPSHFCFSRTWGWTSRMFRRRIYLCMLYRLYSRWLNISCIYIYMCVCVWVCVRECERHGSWRYMTEQSAMCIMEVGYATRWWGWPKLLHVSRWQPPNGSAKDHELRCYFPWSMSLVVSISSSSPYRLWLPLTVLVPRTNETPFLVRASPALCWPFWWVSRCKVPTDEVFASMTRQL